jgi:hypothetical protein
MDLKEEEILGEQAATHWYYISKGRALRRFIAGIKADEVLDVGAGSGIFSKQLLDSGFCRSAVCIDPNYAIEKTEMHNGKPVAFARQAAAVPQDLVLMMDVLEHVDDDAGLLKLYAGPMKAGAHVLITVPAFRFLWSGHDVFLEHRRRYTAGGLENVARAAGLEVVKTRYFFGLLFPAAAVIRLAKAVLLRRKKLEARSELRRYPAWLNKVLIGIHDLERNTVFPVNRLGGLSVFCLCKKT